MTLHLTSCEYAEPEVQLQELHMDERGIEARFKGPAVRAFAESAVDSFKALGGINYVEWSVHRADEGWFTLTMQRKSGKSPGEIVAELNAKLTALKQAKEPT